MSLSLKASSDGLSTELLLGATLLAKFDVNGVADGVLIASDAEAQALTNAKKLITPEKLAKAFQGSNQLLSGSGYQKFPGGLIVQWGVDNGGNVTTNPATFPIAFPTAVFSVLAVHNGTGANYYSISPISTTGFTANRNGAADNSIYYIAIGY